MHNTTKTAEAAAAQDAAKVSPDPAAVGRTLPPPDHPYCSHCLYDLNGLTESSKCPECGRPLVDVLVRDFFPGMMGKRFESRFKLFGLPLVAIAHGPVRGERVGRARGIIAIGDKPVGVLAIGGMPVGIFAFGATPIGVFTSGGLSLGFVAAGGVAVGGLTIGGVSLGLWAYGAVCLGFVGGDGALFISLLNLLGF